MICNDILTGKSGIYKITNLINGKIYIGRSVNLKSRKSKHKTSITKTIISKAIQKYGHDNFKFEVIEYCECDILVEREQYYMDLFNPYDENGYNLLKDSSYGGWTGMFHTSETRSKMSESKKGSIPWNKDKKGVQECSDETRKLMSENSIGEKNPFYGKKHSDETIKHLSVLAKQRDMSHCNKKVIQIDKITGKIIKIWDSISDASEQVIGDRKSSRITAACKGKYKSAGGFKWLYFTQE
jgi:group I intron endonuclease